MENNLDLFICAHKDFKPKVTNKVYKVIHGNNVVTNCDNLPIIDCKLDEKLDDRFYSELYLYKFLSKNYQLKDYIGFNHYRRYWSFLDDIPNMGELFKKVDVITPIPLIFSYSNKDQYKMCHNVEDWELVESIIKDKYPSYYYTFRQFQESNIFLPYNIFIMRKQDFLRYCDFVFGVLDEYIKIVGTDITKRIEENRDKYIKSFSPNDAIEYQYRIGGYLGERLTNIFILKNFNQDRIGMYKIIKTETKYINEGNI